MIGDENKQAWQGAPYSAKGVDDVAFTADLLDTAGGVASASTANAVYATGKSNGAGFTGILACRMADRIAAIAPVAGAFYQQGKRLRAEPAGAGARHPRHRRHHHPVRR